MVDNAGRCMECGSVVESSNGFCYRCHSRLDYHFTSVPTVQITQAEHQRLLEIEREYQKIMQRYQPYQTPIYLVPQRTIVWPAWEPVEFRGF